MSLPRSESAFADNLVHERPGLRHTERSAGRLPISEPPGCRYPVLPCRPSLTAASQKTREVRPWTAPMTC